MVELSSLLIITEAADVPKDFKRVFVGSFGSETTEKGLDLKREKTWALKHQKIDF